MEQIKVEETLQIWLQIALLLTIFEAYFKVNKIWTRKHEQVVSESVSLASQLLGLTAGIPFALLYILQGSYEGAISSGLMLIVNCFMIMIAIGFWVENRRGISFWKNFGKSLRLERGEASNLLRDIFRPAAAKQVIRILHSIAMIDGNLDERELAFLRAFADNWGIDLDQVLMEPSALIGSGARG